MSVYASDDRVTVRGDDFVVRGGPRNRVVIFGPFGWSIFEGPGMDLISRGYGSADDAIRSLIGDPR